MNYFYITGTSRGIGKSLAEELLQSENNIVFGISRKCSIKHSRYKHFYLDLSKPENASGFKFAEHKNANSIVLVNNAGMLGSVSRVGEIDDDETIQAFNLNITSIAIFTNQFLKQYRDYSSKKVILNTSSGAGRHVVESWSTYCSTKAALDMFCRVVDSEQKQFFENPASIYSIAPGIIDTKMQDEIRAIPKEEFSGVDKFIELKNNDQLIPPEQVAKQYIDIILHPENYNDVIMDLREL